MDELITTAFLKADGSCVAVVMNESEKSMNIKLWIWKLYLLICLNIQSEVSGLQNSFGISLRIGHNSLRFKVSQCFDSSLCVLVFDSWW